MEYFASIVTPLCFFLFVLGIIFYLASIAMLSEAYVTKQTYKNAGIVCAVSIALIFLSVLLPSRDYLEKQIKLESCNNEKGGK